MRYLLVHTLPSGVRESHQQLIDEVADVFGVTAVKRDNLPPHVTLKYWFEASPEQHNEVREVLDVFANTHMPVPYALSGAGSFERTVFADIEASADMRALHAALATQLRNLPWMSWESIDFPNNHLHATVASAFPPQLLPEITAYVAARLRPVAISLDALTLIERSTPPEAIDGDARICDSFPLTA